MGAGKQQLLLQHTLVARWVMYSLQVQTHENPKICAIQSASGKTWLAGWLVERISERLGETT